MGRNEKVLIGALLFLGLMGALVWMIVAGSFASPSDNGWVYNYQTLLAALIALGAAGTAILAAKLTIDHQKKVEQERERTDMVEALRILLYEMRDVSIHTLGRFEFALGADRERWLQDINRRKEAINSAVSNPPWLAETVGKLNWNYSIAVHLFYGSAQMVADNITNDATLPLTGKRLFYAQVAMHALAEALGKVERGEDLPQRPAWSNIQDAVRTARALGVTDLGDDTTANIYLDRRAFDEALPLH
jgi:hypothetical protein